MSNVDKKILADWKYYLNNEYSKKETLKVVPPSFFQSPFLLVLPLGSYYFYLGIHMCFGHSTYLRSIILLIISSFIHKLYTFSEPNNPKDIN